MTIIQQLLSEIKTDDVLEKIRCLCDDIQKEEIPNITNLRHLPSGPNIFLALEVPGRNTKEIAFLTLERESADLYFAVLYTLSNSQLQKPDAGLKKQKVWEIDDHRPEKILTSYAKTYKHLRGE